MKIKFLSLLIIVLSLLSCFSNLSKQPAVDVMDAFFSELIIENKDALFDFYSEKFYEVTPESEWRTMLFSIYNKLGSYQSSDLIAWNIRTTAGLSGSGTYYVLKYKSIYLNYTIIENITLFKATGFEEIKIIGHKFESEIFMDGDLDNSSNKV